MSREEFDELPPVRRRAKYDWEAKAREAREASPKWVLAYPSVPYSAMSAVNRPARRDVPASARRAEAFQATDGRFEAAVRKKAGNRYRLYIRFIPYTDEEMMKMEESNGE